MSQLAESMCDNIFSIASLTLSFRAVLGLPNGCFISLFFMLSKELSAAKIPIPLCP
jgi:hypothetical protein